MAGEWCASPRIAQGASPGVPDKPGRRRVRIVVTIHRLSFGGADRVAVMLCNAFVAAGLEARLVILRDKGEGEKTLLNLLDPTVEIRRAGAPLRSRHLELVRGYRFIRGEIASWKPDIVLGSSSNMGLVTGLAARSGAHDRPRTALKFTNPVVRPHDRGILRRAYRERLWSMVLGLHDRVLILSEGERSAMIALYPNLRERLRTVANPYVTDTMLASEPRPGGRPRRILFVGRLMPQKRLDRLIGSFAKMRNEDVELVLLGDGPLRSAVERQIAALGLDARIRLAGFVDDVAERLRTADLLALSSDYEGLPAVVLEALASGVPVVTTDCFEEAHALLGSAPGCAVVPRDDPDALTAALDRALEGRPDRMVLRDLARPYRCENALQAHIQSLLDLIYD